MNKYKPSLLFRLSHQALKWAVFLWLYSLCHWLGWSIHAALLFSLVAFLVFTVLFFCSPEAYDDEDLPREDWVRGG